MTYPLTTAMLSVPFAKVVRGYSFFGFSFVYIIFEDGTDLYWARSRVLEYLNQATLPDAGVRLWFQLFTGADERKLPQLRRSAGERMLSAMLAQRVVEVKDLPAAPGTRAARPQWRAPAVRAWHRGSAESCRVWENPVQPCPDFT